MIQKTSMLARNRTYTSPSIIKPQWIVVHSTGAATANLTTLFNAWNKPSVNLSCHAMVDADGWIQTLPLTYKGWHVGGNGNSISIGFEICEPKNIKYVDQAHTKVDISKYNPADPLIRADFIKRWQNAVECAAWMCKQTGIHPDHVLCHQEMARIGKATKHADVLHWFPLFGQQYNMDSFRAAVADRLRGVSSPAAPIKPTARRKLVPTTVNRLRNFTHTKY